MLIITLNVLMYEDGKVHYFFLCHAHMHGLIHDGWLRACQSCLLGLMYVFRLLYAIMCFRVMACLGFQLVDGFIKGQVLPFSC
jgi:hypothetical protein